jgi:pSer/pThr/pTyr-binding forkhead associated (FHA) protein
VNDPLIARFADACGATAPLDLRVGVADGGVLAEGRVHQPFTLIGRDDACDVTLSDPEVNPRHAWLQVVGGRVYALDLGSRAGLVWPDGATRSGWLDLDTPVRVGPFRVHLQKPAADAPAGVPADPLHTDPSLNQSCPAVTLDFRNGKRAKDRWAVNRTITLIGRSEACKLHLHADDISGYHCGLVLTRAGLWVVDLSGRGVVVNGERMRVAPLGPGAELWVGRFLIGCTYPPDWDEKTQPQAALTVLPKTDAVRPAEPFGPPSTVGAGGPPTRVTPILPLFPEDEVQLGGLPAQESTWGLPSSHIMCDAFQAPSPSGPLSTPIFVGSGQTPPHIPSPPKPPAPKPPAPDLHPPAEPAEADTVEDSAVGTMLRHLGEIHARMGELSQESLLLIVRMLGQGRSESKPAVEREVARIRELNRELTKLHTEIADLALAQAVNGPDPGGVVAETARPQNGARPAPAAAGMSEDAIQDWIQEQIGTLHRERSHCWVRLVGLLSPDDTKFE